MSFFGHKSSYYIPVRLYHVVETFFFVNGEWWGVARCYCVNFNIQGVLNLNRQFQQAQPFYILIAFSIITTVTVI